MNFVLKFMTIAEVENLDTNWRLEETQISKLLAMSYENAEFAGFFNWKLL